MKKIHDELIHGKRSQVVFAVLAKKHLVESSKRSINRDMVCVEQLLPFIGEQEMTQVYRGYVDGSPTPLEQFILDRAKKGVSVRTANYALQVLNTIGNRATRDWRMLEHWTSVPLLKPKDLELDRYKGLKKKRRSVPLTWDEQEILFKELPDYLKDMCLFKVNTGCREQEVCQLRWDWFDRTTYSGMWFFALPLDIVKNRDHVDEGRPVVLNDIAKDIIRKQIGNGSEWVFPHPGTSKPLQQMNCTAYQTARERASKILRGIKMTNIHALKHTYGARLKAAGVSKDDRRDLLGHKNGDVTDLYCAKELTRMLENTNKVTQEKGKLILWKRAV
ncbi:MAG TPA: tyrosine-type recombinase/integrase [Nitrospinaceae bacterium]|nr:tyrosine-type recombinase/integrase [Nitrospinaceae bacterium]